MDICGPMNNWFSLQTPSGRRRCYSESADYEKRAEHNHTSQQEQTHVDIDIGSSSSLSVWSGDHEDVDEASKPRYPWDTSQATSLSTVHENEILTTVPSDGTDENEI